MPPRAQPPLGPAPAYKARGTSWLLVGYLLTKPVQLLWPRRFVKLTRSITTRTPPTAASDVGVVPGRDEGAWRDVRSPVRPACRMLATLAVSRGHTPQRGCSATRNRSCWITA